MYEVLNPDNKDIKRHRVSFTKLPPPRRSAGVLTGDQRQPVRNYRRPADFDTVSSSKLNGRRLNFRATQVIAIRPRQRTSPNWILWELACVSTPSSRETAKCWFEFARSLTMDVENSTNGDHSSPVSGHMFLNFDLRSIRPSRIPVSFYITPVRSWHWRTGENFLSPKMATETKSHVQWWEHAAPLLSAFVRRGRCIRTLFAPDLTDLCYVGH